MSNDLTVINEDSKLVLQKARNLIGISKNYWKRKTVVSISSGYQH